MKAIMTAPLSRILLRIFLIPLLMTLTLTACKHKSENASTERSISHNAILKGFTFGSPLTKKSVEADLKAPTYTLKNVLSHTDPLDLGTSNFVISGSYTLWPVTRKIVTSFNNDGYIGSINLSQSTTSHSMKAMCRGEKVEIVNASHRLTSAEQDMCDETGTSPIYIKVGYDPLVLITHESNNLFEHIPFNRLKELFASTNWSQFNTDFPDKPIEFYLPKKNDGAMAVMSEALYDSAKAPTLRNLPNAHYYPFNLELTHDLAENPTGLGFVSFGKLLKLQQSYMKIIPINGRTPIKSGSKYPIKRGLYLVTNTKAIQKPEVQTFIAYYLNHVHKVMPTLGFTPLGDTDAKEERTKLIGILNLLMPEGNPVSLRR
ncbi:MAG: substrate-binding domain-containing protein [Cocleimonas sp.]